MQILWLEEKEQYLIDTLESDVGLLETIREITEKNH